MSLALLMTFSTCDPFNKSVHIIPRVFFHAHVETNQPSKRGVCVFGIPDS